MKIFKKLKQYFCKHDFIEEHVKFGYFNKDGFMYELLKCHCKKCKKTFFKAKIQHHVNCRCSWREK